MDWNWTKSNGQKLIMGAKPLLIYDTPEAIQCTQAILDFTMLAQYVLYDDETVRYIEHALYRLENTKIAFEHHRPIKSKLCQPPFNKPKFHAISHFIQCIRDYGSAVNYNTTHSKVVHKYFTKAFYNKTNKKKYHSQIQ